MALLPPLEEAADRLFSSIGLGPLPPPASLEELSRAAAILLAGDPPVGFVRIEIIEGIAHLEQVSVDPSHSRQGIGGSLVVAACDWAAARGHSQITLITFRDIAWNGPFYRRLGFSDINQLTPGLERLLEQDRKFGLDRMGTRIVMVRMLA